MNRIAIIEKIESSAHYFLHGLKVEYTGTKEAAVVIQKYIKYGSITPDEEHLLKSQLVDSLKMAGVVVPFVLIPGASILMPILIKVAGKHNIELMPSAFNSAKQKEGE